MPDEEELEYEDVEISHRSAKNVYKEETVIPNGVDSVIAQVYLVIGDDVNEYPPPKRCHLADIIVLQILVTRINILIGTATPSRQVFVNQIDTLYDRGPISARLP